MALGTMTRDANHSGGAISGAPLRMDHLTFAGDGTYAAGGTTGFQALVRAVLGIDVRVIAVIPEDCGGYVPVYIPATDALKIYQCGGAGAPMAEDVTANQSGRTYKMHVVSV